MAQWHQIVEFCYHCATSTPRNYLNHCWFIVNWIQNSNLQKHLSRNIKRFIPQNPFETIVWKRLTILLRPGCVKLRLSVKAPDSTNLGFEWNWKRLQCHLTKHLGTWVEVQRGLCLHTLDRVAPWCVGSVEAIINLDILDSCPYYTTIDEKAKNPQVFVHMGTIL